MLFRHILHFPEKLQPSAIYGLAVHTALHAAHLQTIQTKKRPKESHVLQVFSAAINRSRLAANDKQRLEERGKENLSQFLKSKESLFLPTDQSEFDFSHESIEYEGLRLTGKIDLVRHDALNAVKIIDYKTGTPFSSWRLSNPFAQIRAQLYKHQLIFYKLLVEQSLLTTSGITVSELDLVFVEPDENGTFHTLRYEPTIDETTRTYQLLKVVWRKIMDLDFPDTSMYSLDLKGLLAFEEDLLNG